MSKANKLFQEQLKLYGYNQMNSLSFSLRFALYSATRIVYEYGNPQYLNSYLPADFAKKIGLNINYDRLDTLNILKIKNPTYDLSAKVKTYLENLNAPENEIREILDLLNPYTEELLHKLNIERASQDLFEGKENTQKVDLLRSIVNCPYTDVLKMVGSFSRTAVADLSLILFNHPKQGEKYITYNIFHKEKGKAKITSLAYVLMVRAYQLSISDFKRVGLGQEINKDELTLLKEHILTTVEQKLRDYGIIASRGTKRFNNPLLNKLLYATVEKMHAASAFNLDNAFVGVKRASDNLNLPDSLTSYLSKGAVLTEEVIKRSIDSIYGFVTDALYRGTRTTYPSMEDFQFYYDAIDALNDLSYAKEYVETLLKIDNNLVSDYQDLWYDDSYKAWNVITQLQDLFGTDPLSFESLDQQIFATGKFEPHHMNPGHKESLALYDQILTNNDYHNTYKTILFI